VRSFAFDLPKPIARPAPDCICRERKIQAPMKTRSAASFTRSAMNQGVESRQAGRDLHALLLQLGHELRVERRVGREGPAIGIRAGDLLPGDHDIRDPSVVRVAEELAVGDVAAAAALAGVLEQRDERQDQQENDHPKGEVAKVRIHLSGSIPEAEGERAQPSLQRNLGSPGSPAK
jgi:hypothetical protein